ncbi:MAG: AIR synthase-related protein [Eubacterium sp.]
MRRGKISQNQWNRSIDKKILYRSNRLMERPASGREVSGYQLSSEMIVCNTMQTEKGPVPFLGKKVFYRMYNALLAVGANVESMLVQLFLPEKESEQSIKKIMEQLGQYGAAHEIAIGSVHAEVSAEVSAALLTLSGIGECLVPHIGSGAFCPGQYVVMTKWAGAYAAAELAFLQKKSLVQHFPTVYVEEAMQYLTEEVAGESLFSVYEEMRYALQFGAKAFHNVSKSGIFGSLWELAEMSGTGLEIDLEAIPVRQESIEICEQYGENPYEIDSLGSLLIGTEKGGELVRILRQNGIPAAVIGRVTKGNDRMIRHGEETRFLTPP